VGENTEKQTILSPTVGSVHTDNFGVTETLKALSRLNHNFEDNCYLQNNSKFSVTAYEILPSAGSSSFIYKNMFSSISDESDSFRMIK
jgi:hypothetical protein